MNFFESIAIAPPDSIFGLNQSFAADKRACKVNLGAGVYKTDELKPFILNTVKEAEGLILAQEKSKDYLPIDGLPAFVELTKELVFGPEHDQIYGAQATGGTGALRIGGRFLQELGLKTIYLPIPTWDNHHRIFQHAGLAVQTYPYFSWEKKGFDLQAMLSAIGSMEKGSIILLHACCHNPTGCDPTPVQWKMILEQIHERGIFPFFDFAYQGFGEGIEPDARIVRQFAGMGGEGLVATSYAKNFGLYAERCGALFAICRDSDEAKRVGSRIKLIIRGMYSNPPLHGAQIVATILADSTLRQKWEGELASMKQRIDDMRQLLAKELGFQFLASQKGMFSYTSLSSEQVARLTTEYGIYLPSDGRINLAGLNRDNVQVVINAIKTVSDLSNAPSKL